MTNFVENIHIGDKLCALILRVGFRAPGIQFFTGQEQSLQFGYMHYEAGHAISPHIHKPLERKVFFTNEVLFLKSGRVKVDFFDNAQQYSHSAVMEAGDTILLMEGGHGFEVLDACEMIEVKQGPYAGEHDKVRF